MSQIIMFDSEQFFQRLEGLLGRLEGLLENPSNQQSEDEGELPELLSRKQAAKFLGVSLGTVDNLSRTGILQKRYVGSMPKFQKEELLKAAEGWKKYQRN